MLSFVGCSTPAPVSSPSERKLDTYWHILKTLTSNFNINANSTRWRIQLSVAKSFNPLLPININLHSVVRKLLVVSSLSQRESRCPIQRISLWFFLTASSYLINSYLLPQPNQQHESFEYSRSNFFSSQTGEDTLLSIASKILITCPVHVLYFHFVRELLTLSCGIEILTFGLFLPNR